MGRPKNGKIWKHFATSAGNTKSVICRYCDTVYKLANVNKMAKHLINCVKCPVMVKREIDQTNPGELTTTSSVNSTQFSDALSSSNYVQASKSCPKMSDEHKEYLHEKLAKAIIVSGAPFAMVEHPLWIEFFEELEPSYKLPNRKAISSKYLNKLYNETSNDITTQLKSARYLHLQCDGWSNIRSEGVINFLISKPEIVFVRSLATESNNHTSAYLAEEIMNVMKEYGEEKFVVLTADNARNVQGALKEVQNVYPHVVPLNCVAHCLNLISDDFLKCSTLKNCFLLVIEIIKTIKYNKVLSSIFSKICKDKGSGEQLKLPVKTRWGSYVTSLNSLINSKVPLQALAVHEKVNLKATTKSSLLCEDFWNMLNFNLKLFQPMAEWIITLESNQYSIHRVYFAFKDIQNKLRDAFLAITAIDDNDKKELLSSFGKRMKMCVKPIHLAASLLDPNSQGHDLTSSDYLIAMQFIYDMGTNFNVNVMVDLANYKAREDLWASSFVWSCIQEISPCTWWKSICVTTQLSRIAVRILTAPCTSAATERSFSTQSFIHSKKRNRLTADNAGKVCFISHNWNLCNKDIRQKGTSQNTLPAEDEIINSANSIEEAPSTSTGITHSTPHSSFNYFQSETDNNSDSDFD